MRADMFCQLDGKPRDAARAALDQDFFAGLQLQRVLDGDQRGQPDKRQRVDVDM